MTVKTDIQITSIPVSYLHRFDQLLKERGLKTDQLLAEVGIGLSMSTLDQELIEIALDQLEDLFQLAIERTGDNALGFYLGNRMPITTHGILGYAAMSGQNLRETINTIVRYFKTINQLMRLSVSEQGRTTVLQIDDNYHFRYARKFLHEVLIGAINGMFKVVTDQSFCFSEICFAYPAPTNLNVYNALFDCPVVFDAAATQLKFPTHQLDTPLIFADKNAHAMSAQQCEQKLEALRQNEDLVGQVRAILLSSKGHYPTADELADQLNMTQRTFRRRLARTETSYTEILSDVRHQHALEYIQSKQLKIGEIAYLLGYSDPNNFGRAFKKWTNRTPAEYRSDILKM